MSEGKPQYQRKVKRATKLVAHEAYLRGRQESAKPLWIPATVLYREIVERGYKGGQSQLRAFMRMLKPAQGMEPLVRFETRPGEQMQVDWVEFRKRHDPLHAFCAALGYSRASYVEYAKHSGFVINLCRYRAKTKGKFERFNGYLRRSFYIPMTSRLAQG